MEGDRAGGADGAGRRRTRLLVKVGSIVAAVVVAGSLTSQANAQAIGWQADVEEPGHSSRRTSYWGFQSGRRGPSADAGPDEILQENALKTFDKELPHWLHRIAAKASEPLTARLSALPAVGAASRVSTLRREFQRVGGQVTFVDDHDPKKAYRKWQELHHEVCHVLGFELPERSSNRFSSWEEASLDLPLCPELWVDEAWPPCKLAPSFRGRVVPVWSAAGNARNGERSLMILQGRIVRSFPARQIKALIGHELGRMAFALLTGPGLKAWAGRLSKVVVGQKLLEGVQSMSGHPGRGLFDLIGGSRRSLFGFDPFGRQSRSYSLGTINLSLFGGRGRSDGGHAQDGAGVLQGPQLSSGIVRPIMEMLAVDMVVKHAAPRVLRPIIWLGVLARGGPESMMDSIRQGMNGLALPGLQLSGHRRPAFWAPMVSLMAPFMHILVQLGALRSASAVIASCGRSSVITADRAAALSAGDAEDAAAAILRVYGQMPMESARGDELEALLDEAADSARRQKWTLRREALLQRWSLPAPEERVRELLRWSESSTGQRLLALAELRRASYTSSLGWWHWCWSQSSESSWMSAFAWQQLAARVLVVVLVALPFFSRVDLVRWASMCTLGVTMLGLLAPLLLRGAGLSPAAAAVSACSLVLYASFAWIVWWNHLLGGSRRWAQLSSRLTSQLADQADVTAGIAYLTRDWAEMARRSHAALDQEFCGSWRTSLHELASKLTDIWSDIRNASLCSGLDGASPRVKSARSVSVPRAALDHDAGYPYQDRGQQAVTRAGSAPLGGQAMMALQLWLKVDRAVQRALHVEAERMRKALDTDDPKTLQAMMNWWSANNSSVASAAAAAISTGTGLLDDGWEEQQETLGALLLSERLHQRFQYRSFAKGDEMPGSEEPGVGVEEFERLEQALAANFESLQDLRRRLAPLASPAGTLRCPCRSDLLQGAAEVQSMLRRSLSSSSSHVVMMRRTEEGKQAPEVLEDSPEDRRSERRILMTLALAACCGVAAVPYAAIARAWLWSIAFFGFALANIVLLLNYQRLSLPHVHRRFERQLSHLSSRREEILVEIRDLQRSSQKAGAAHARACIFLQSVNVLRNINYVVLCIKTETQRAAAAAMGGMGGMQESVVLGGLRLLLALLPRCEQRWEAEILADDDCRVAVAALADAESEPSARLVAESQKRLWILLRMVHLSSVLPIEAQGQLGSLVQRYARPILIEGRVPLQNASALEMHNKADHKEETLLKAAGNEKRRTASKGLPLSARRALPASEEMPDWMSQSFGAVPSSAPTESVIKDLLKQLRATRKDCIRILQRLPPEALLSRIGEDTTAVLRDLLSSVIVTVLPGSGPVTPRSNGWSLGRPRSSSGRVAVALGYRHGETVYVVENLRLNLLLRVATIRGEIEDARSGSINELRKRGNSGPSRAEEIEVPLTAVLEEAPGEEEAEALWLSLAAAYPGFYGNNALQERKSALRRVSAAARQMRRG